MSDWFQLIAEITETCSIRFTKNTNHYVVRLERVAYTTVGQPKMCVYDIAICKEMPFQVQSSLIKGGLSELNELTRRVESGTA